LLTPLAAAVLLRAVGYRGTVTFMALVFLVPTVLAAMTPAAEWDALSVKPDKLESLVDIVLNPLFWLVGLALFFYVPLEFTMGTWATTYLTGRGIHERTAALLLSGFWLAIMVSRLGASFLLSLLERGYHSWVVVGLAIGSALALAVMVSAFDRSRAAISLLLTGICFGPIFPTLVGLLLDPDRLDKRLHGTAYGAAFSLGLTGGIVFPPLIGYLARRWYLQRALNLTVLWAIILTALTLLMALAF
jgi:fucose permease